MFNGKEIVSEIAYTVVMYIGLVAVTLFAVFCHNVFTVAGILDPIQFSEVAPVVVAMAPVAIVLNIVLTLGDELINEIKSVTR